MSIQKFPLAAVKKVKQYIQDALTLSDVGQQVQSGFGLDDADELPEPESLDELSNIFSLGGLDNEDVTTPNLQVNWCLSTVNPATALLKLPGVQLKPGFRLVSYLYRANQDGVGLVFAVPESFSTTAQLEKALTSSTLEKPPRPEGALPHFMDAVQGDRSPVSFIVASLLQRELREFGAIGKYCNWSHHRLIDAIPAQVKWQWQGEQPKDLSPKVKVLPDGQAAIEFFTCRIKEPIAIFRHVDQYTVGHYRANSIDKPIASVQR